MMHHRFPPLDSLVFFEAVARHASFSLAAQELSVTQAAVSKRIANLESKLGVLLFDRTSKKPQLTSDGIYMFDKSKKALNFLASAFEHLGDKGENPIHIASDNSVAYFWLLQRLKRFSLSEESCEINLTTVKAEEEIDFDATDIIVHHCDGKVDGWKSSLLFEEVLAPVASPQIAENFEKCRKYEFYDPQLTPKLLTCLPRTPTCVSWDMWSEQLQFDGFSKLSSQRCRSYVNSIGAAIEGKGIALCNLHLNSHELASGQLRQIGSNVLRTGRGYYLMHPNQQSTRNDVETLLDFLMEAAPFVSQDEKFLRAS